MLAEHPSFVVFLAAVAAPLIAPQAGLLRWRLPPRRELAPPALYSAVASLGLVVVIANVGLKSGCLDSEVAAQLSLVVYPTAAHVLLARAPGDTAAAGATSARA